eukprot:m51a1_g4560 hypothetical protein (314) ;mRNA; f:114488-115805
MDTTWPSDAQASSGDVAAYSNRLASAVVACVSLLGALSVVVLSVATRRVRLLCWRVLSYSALAEATTCVTVLFTFGLWDRMEEAPVLCDVAGFLMSVGSVSSNLWILFMATVLVQLVRPHGGISRLPGPATEVAYHFFVAVVAAALGSYPLAHLGGARFARNSSGYCHVARDPAWARLPTYLLNWAIIFAIAMLYVAAYLYVRSYLVERDPEEQPTASATPEFMKQRSRVMCLLHQMWLYPVVLAATWLPSTVARSIDAVTPYGDNAWSATIVAVVVPMGGLLQFVCFLITSNIVNDARASCCSGSDWDQRDS